MNNLRNLALTLLIIFLIGLFNTGCGKDKGSSTASHGKALWSNWTETTDGSTLNLTDGAMGVALDFTLTFDDGAQCIFALTITGTESSGDYLISNGLYISGGTDPGCAGLTEVGTFTLSSSTLSICPTGLACSVYK